MACARAATREGGGGGVLSDATRAVFEPRTPASADKNTHAYGSCGLHGSTVKPASWQSGTRRRGQDQRFWEEIEEGPRAMGPLGLSAVLPGYAICDSFRARPSLISGLRTYIK
uniref:Uncharacterized protein n=1 Tax=Oryza nivara TaxID=4536 RepID=A0A0E0IA70_ORYNI